MESPSNTSIPGSPASLAQPSPKNRSRPSSRGSHLTLDLSNIPPLSQRAPPSNTLLITNLNNLETFHPENLQTIQNTINSHAHIVSWAPLKSLRRIICTFPSEQEAIIVRQVIDGEMIMGDRCRVYFGEGTPVEPRDQHLQAPDMKKLFFISPPPSPPHGWEAKDEEPPNTLVLAEDLAKALNKLRAKDHSSGVGYVYGYNVENEGRKEDGGVEGSNWSSAGRSRSGSTILFEPENDDKHMPAISVEDFTDSSEISTPVSPNPPAILHTSRPPVEIMQDA